MSDECIHGFDIGLCAACYPKAVPEVAPVVKQRVSRARPEPLLAPRRTASSGSRASSAKRAVDNVGEQRIYHVTHINNLPAILAGGALLADMSAAWDTRPTIDISSAEARESRRTALVSMQGNLSVAGYVPFFLSPNASVWDSVRAHATDSRLVLDGHGSAAYDFVILVSTVKKVIDGQAADAESHPAAIAVTDGDAGNRATRFGSTAETSERMLRKLRADPDEDALLEAEFLVKEAFPFDRLSILGVANDKVREVVKDILAASDYSPKVAVYPPWFQPTEESAL